MSHLNIKNIPKDDEIGRILHNEMTGEFMDEYVTIDDNGTCVPKTYTNITESIENFEVRNDDVWVCSFPRSGTTWSQEMTWLIANDLDYEGAKEPLSTRFPFLEFSMLFNEKRLDKQVGAKNLQYLCDSVGFTKSIEGRRFIKCHLPFSLLPREIRKGTKTPKIIYVMRNPKDVCVSFYHLYMLLLGAKTTLENFTKAFLAEKVLYGSYWKHILGYWEHGSLSNLLIIKYEDMKKNLPLVINNVTRFLNKNITEDQMEKLEKHLSFESMKTNPATNGNELSYPGKEAKNVIHNRTDFIRSGTVGKYKDELSPETTATFDAWIYKNIDDITIAQEYKY